jgi:GDP-L-fucose synthase
MLGHINVGSGVDVSIKELTETIAKITGYSGKIKWDLSKPDGAPRKLMDSTKLNNLGWSSKTNLEDGLWMAYNNYLEMLGIDHVRS